MQKIPSTIVFLFISLFYSPGLVHADLVAPPYTPPTFESIQQLKLSLKISGISIAASSTSNVTIPTGDLVPITYEFSNIPTWPNPNLSSKDNASALDQTIKESRIFISLWAYVILALT